MSVPVSAPPSLAPSLTHLLLVEDDDGLAELFQLELEGIGLPIERATSGAEAMARLTARPDCLVLLDYSLPDMTARSMIESLGGQGQVPPFIVTTGHGDERVAVSMMKLGARDYLVKDTLLLERLRSVVERVLREIENQRRLAESERKFQTLFESSNDGIMLLEGERFIDCNRRTLELFGLGSKEELLGHHPCEVSPPRQPDGRDSLSAAREYFRSAQERGTCRFEWTHRRRDGTDLPCEIQLSTLELDGRPLVQATVRDISERAKAEEELRRSESKFATVFQSCPEPIALTSAATGRYLDGNEAFLRSMRATREEMIGRSAVELRVWDDPQDRERWLALLQQKGRVQGHEARLRNRSGEVRDFRISSEGIEIDGEACFVHFAEDVTERNRSTAALRESEERYRHLLGSVTDYVYVVGIENGLPVSTTHGTGCVSVTGFSPEDYGRQPFLWLDMIPSEDRPMVERQAATALRGEMTEPIEHRIRHKDGSLRWVRNTLVPRHDSGGRHIACDGLISDITRRKQAELALQERQARLDSIFRAAPVGIGVVVDRVITEVNHHLCEMSGFAAEEMIGRSARLMYPSDEEFKRVGEVKYRQIAERGSGTIETRWQRKDGRIIDVLLSSCPIIAGDLSAGVTFSALDITERKRADRELRETTARLSEAQRIARLGSYTLDVPASRWTSSEELDEIFGIVAHGGNRSVEEWIAIVHPADRAMMLRYFEDEVIGRGRRFDREYRIVRLVDGAERWVHGTGELKRDANGRITHMIGMIQDVTDRRQAELAMQRSETELRAIYEHAPVIMCLIDEQTRIVRANNAALRFAGRDVLGSVGTRGGDLLGCLEALRDPLGCGFGPECTACILRRTVLDTLHTGTPHHQVEVAKPVRRDGIESEIALLVSTARIELDGQLRLLLAFEDVTARRKAEKRALEQAALLDIAQDAILVRNFDDQILYWNQGAVRLYGWSMAEAMSRPCRELLCANDAGCVTAEKAVLATGAWIGEMSHQTRDRGTVPVLSRWTLVRDAAGQPASVLIVNTDQSENHRLNAQLMRAQRLESIGTLASGIAHDLNNVLSPIVMSLNMLRDHIKDAAATGLVDTMEDCLHRAADIVRQVLTFARGSSGARAEIQPKHVIQEIARIARETFPRSIDVSVDFCHDPWRFLGDPTQLQQVLMNLCVNARDAMPAGGRLGLRVDNVTLAETDRKLHPHAAPGRYGVISVADTGTGIPAEVIDKIFDPFFTTKPVGQGTGLGLAMAAGIVERHGGFLLVSSEPGCGSTFRVYLPAIASSDAGETATGTKRAAPAGQGELILVVDDEVAVREVIASMLRSAGYRALLAREGGEALALYQKRRTDIGAVLTDLMMPGIDGPTLIHRLRTSHPEARVVAMTGLGEEEVLASVLADGVDTVLEKPFAAEDLLAVLHKMLHAPETVGWSRTPA